MDESSFSKDTDSIEKISEEIKKCKKCNLWLTRTNCVPGEGSENARLMFIGEAPGREEDLQGRPFVGNAGKLLTETINKILGLKRDQVFITNILKCRPPNNRDPLPEEIDACGDYLLRQIKVLSPEVIVCLGRHSASLMFDLYDISFPGITKVRGKVFEVSNDKDIKKRKIMAVYHPAAILYRPQLREIFEKDFRKLKEILGKTPVEKGKEKGKKFKTLSDFF